MNRALLCLTLLILTGAQAVGAQTVAIINARIETATAAGEITAGTLVMRDGRIVAVGASARVPAGARVVDAQGGVVTPGLIAPSTNVMVDEVNLVPQTRDDAGGDRISAAFDVQYGINPASAVVKVGRQSGITEAVITPLVGRISAGADEDDAGALQGGGDGASSDPTLFGGQAAIVRLTDDPNRAIVRTNVAVALELGEAGAAHAGGSRGATLVLARSALDDARHFARNRGAYDRGDSRAYGLSRVNLEALVPVVEGRTPLLVRVDRASDIQQALRFAREQRVKIILESAREGWLVAGEIAKAGVPVLLDAQANLPNEFESLGARLDNAARLHAAGVLIAMKAKRDFNSLRPIRLNAGTAVAYGLPYQAAIASVTINPARIWGIADRTGSLEVGKDANVVLWSGDPLETTSYTRAIFIGGVEQANTSRRLELRDRYLAPDDGYPPAYHSASLAARTYSVVMSGAVKGALTVSVGNNGVRRATLKFADRGRGPDLTTTSRFDRRGILESFTVDGVDYAKRAVSERFTVRDGRAEWTSSADSGTQPAGAFYLASQSNSEDLAALARALLVAPGHELALLPAGRARIEKVLDHKVTVARQSTTATLFLITGLDLQPGAIWLDPERELFAAGGSWLGLVQQGFEPAWADLLATQDQALAAAAERRDGKLQRRPATPIVIRNANMFDAESRRMRPNVSVLVRGTRIEAVGESATLTAPEGAEIIDARGGTLLPGLWDMHVHLLDRAEGILDLLAGVTSVRDMGNDLEGLQKLTQHFDEGSLAGPWVLKAGLIEGPGPFAAPIGILTQTGAQVRDAVNLYADRGYAQIKLYSSLPPELVGDAITAAHARGLRVSGHVPAGMTMREAVLAGFDEVQHANFWFLTFMPPDILAKTNTPVRFSAVYEHGRELDLSGSTARDFIALLVARKTVVDPTLVVFENMFTGQKGTLAPWMAPWVERLPPMAARGGRSGGRATTAEQRATYTESFTRMKQMLKALHDAGVPIVPGTDGGALQFSRELELYAEAGIPTADVLYIATLGAARVMGKDREVGSISPGKRADLVLIDGDPIRRIGDVRKTRLVMKGGDIYDSAALAVAAGLTPDRRTTGAHGVVGATRQSRTATRK